MDGQRRFAVIGTDARLAAAGRALARAGFAVGGPEQTALADYILLPLPLDESRTPLAELLRAAKPGALALGGKLSAQARQIAAEAGVELVDYFAREELILCNAIPTAEGCIGILMAERTRTLWNSAILLAGLYAEGQTTVIEPAPSRDHTERMFRALGVEIETNGNVITLEPPEDLHAVDIAVPADISSAAFFLVAGAIVPGSELTIRNVGVNPTRTGILDVLRSMGADITESNFRDDAEPVCDLTVRRADERAHACGLEAVIEVVLH